MTYSNQSAANLKMGGGQGLGEIDEIEAATHLVLNQNSTFFSMVLYTCGTMAILDERIELWL